jgi:hypothetical protein
VSQPELEQVDLWNPFRLQLPHSCLLPSSLSSGLAGVEMSEPSGPLCPVVIKHEGRSCWDKSEEVGPLMRGSLMEGEL